MKLDIEQLKSEFESRLNAQNWFKSVGKHSLDADEISTPFRVKFAKFEQLSRLLKSNEWNDIDLDIFPEICRFSDQILRQYSLMDELAGAAREILSVKKDRFIKDIRTNGLPTETYDYSVFLIVLRAFQEYGIRKICPNFRIDFNTNLIKILNLGYLPCGWKHNVPKLRKAYNPITFVGDSVKRQDKFSYGDGVLYVY
ncbi:hypothetical protein H7R39_05355 [Campylobacter sp. Marseille-Q3452]|uniref:Uncharacterized protein n=1 Tax=Campylobacter massiliensis TaxID=2762557 RepID=A0A842J4C3_9BACT|nr:hypothetical protein [Campylobacter massiliensis]MBC2882686.1 hypothetical protein [Campylobacter massiliensis]